MNAKKARLESYNNQLYDCLMQNMIMFMFILHEQFHFGEDRLTRCLTFIREYAQMFDDQARDGILEENIDDYRKKYRQNIREILKITTKNILPPDFYAEVFENRCPTRAETVSKYNRETKAKIAKTAVSFSQAAEMQRAAQIFQSFLRERGDNNEIQTAAMQTLRRGDEVNT